MTSIEDLNLFAVVFVGMLVEREGVREVPLRRLPSMPKRVGMYYDYEPLRAGEAT